MCNARSDGQCQACVLLGKCVVVEGGLGLRRCEVRSKGG